MAQVSRSVFGKNLRAFRESRGITQQQIADVTDTTNVTVNKWENRGVQPRRKIVDDLLAYYSLDEDDLLSDVSGLYAQIHGLTSAPAGAIAAKKPRRAYAPLLGRVHAGEAVEPDILDSEIPIPYEVWEHHQSGYFLQVEGTCMNKVYAEGCYVFIDPTMQPRDGSIAVSSIDGTDYIIRRLRMGATTLILSPESFDPQWEDIIITRESGKTVTYEGVVVWYQSDREMD